jgi:uncharacterized membrane protein YsdA (DUF1294 family)/cold shock CspA family protein
MRYQGKVTRWKDEQGFGFIVPNGGGEAVFLHIKSFSRRGRRPVDGEIVTYDLVFDGKARARAQSVAFVDESAIVPRGKSDAVWLLMALVSMAFVVHAAWLGKLPKLAPAIYVVASLFAFAVYAWDKSAARNGEWRTQESTLHLLALVGGWPGALFAQKLLRHKSKKTSFQVMFWVTVLANCGVLGWLMSPQGAAAWRGWSSVV